MWRSLRVRFWLSSVSAVASTVLAVLAVVTPDWIEIVFGVDPDQGDHVAEWIVATTLAVSAGALWSAGRAEWLRAKRIASAVW